MKKPGIKGMKKNLLTGLALLEPLGKGVCVMGLRHAEPGTKDSKTNSAPPMSKRLKIIELCVQVCR